VAIFGRRTARQRLRRAARESLTVPAFSSPIDCTPWVIGGLWPAELSAISAENATLAEYLKVDLQRIANSANDELKVIRRAGLADLARQADEARVIDDARARAVRRVESAVGDLRTVPAEIPAAHRRPGRVNDFAGIDLAETEVLPAITEDEEPEPSGARHRGPGDDSVSRGPEPYVASLPDVPQAPQAAVVPGSEPESDKERLQRILAFVVRQEPGLRWAVGDRTDGTTVVVTDLAHGWIPPGIALPEGVRLLEPERRTGRASTLVGDTTCAASYAPGDSLSRSADFVATNASVLPRELAPVADLGWVLGQATHWRDELPRIVHTLARAAAAGTGVVDEEVDLLRVHLDTAHYQLLAQYPDIDPALLLNCLLLAATERLVSADTIAANYHLAWFQKLTAPPPSKWAAKPAP
jgi:Family of unknown function (DUF5631)/Family of unknown function (DUF5632)